MNQHDGMTGGKLSRVKEFGFGSTALQHQGVQQWGYDWAGQAMGHYGCRQRRARDRGALNQCLSSVSPKQLWLMFWSVKGRRSVLEHSLSKAAMSLGKE